MTPSFHPPYPWLVLAPSIMSSLLSSPSRAPFTNITNDASLLSSPTRGKRRGEDQIVASKRVKLELKPETSSAQEVDPFQASSSTLPPLPPLRRPGLYGLRHALRTGDLAARRTLARTYPFSHVKVSSLIALPSSFNRILVARFCVFGQSRRF